MVSNVQHHAETETNTIMSEYWQHKTSKPIIMMSEFLQHKTLLFIIYYFLLQFPYLVVAVGLAELFNDRIFEVRVVEWQGGGQLECPLHQPAALLHAHYVKVHPARQNQHSATNGVLHGIEGEGASKGGQLQCPLHQPAALLHAHDVKVHPAGQQMFTTRNTYRSILYHFK
jgi:hypothetical protein